MKQQGEEKKPEEIVEEMKKTKLTKEEIAAILQLLKKINNLRWEDIHGAAFLENKLLTMAKELS